MSIEAGQVIDEKYRVVKLLGKGGMGAVYLAEHLVIGRKVAVKVLLGSVAENQTAVARFEREAQAAGRIGSDHILEIFDFGSLPDGARYMVCEYLEGETLADRLNREQRLSPAALVPVARQLLMGLAAAHQAGVVHRDLKPENIFILRQKAGLSDFVKIIDFGISKFQPLSTGEGMQMTATGIVVGTPCYLSPEQARGSREADARSDLYAVGVILYEAVTGTLPFNSDNVNDLLFKIVLEDPRPVLEAAPDLDPAFGALIQTAMSRDPQHRHASAEAMIEALDGWSASRGLSVSGPSFVRSSSSTTSSLRLGSGSGDVKVPSGSSRSLLPTPGTWADSQLSVAAFQPQRRSRRVLVIGGVVAALLLGGVSFALLGGGEAPSGAAAAGSTTLAAPASAPPAPELPSPPPTLAPAPAEAAPPPSPAPDPNAALEPANPEPAPRAAAPVRRPAASAPPKASPKKASPAPAAAPAASPSKQRRDYGY